MKLSPARARPLTRQRQLRLIIRFWVKEAWFHPVGRKYLIRFFIIIIILVLSIRAAISR